MNKGFQKMNEINKAFNFQPKKFDTLSITILLIKRR